MIPAVFSSPIPIANDQARKLDGQTQAQAKTTQTVQPSTFSHSTPHQRSGSSSSAVCSAPYCTTVAEMTGTVTSEAPWLNTNQPRVESTSAFVPQQRPQHEYQHQTQQQPNFDEHHVSPDQRQIYLNAPTSQPTGRNLQTLPTLHADVRPQPQDDTRRSNAH
jgi:hypothetical protein